MIAECRGLAWIYLLREQCLYARQFNPMSAVAQYQVQHQHHTAVAGFVIAGDHIPARLERKRQRGVIYETSLPETNREHQKAYIDT